MPTLNVVLVHRPLPGAHEPSKSQSPAFGSLILNAMQLLSHDHQGQAHYQSHFPERRPCVAAALREVPRCPRGTGRVCPGDARYPLPVPAEQRFAAANVATNCCEENEPRG